MDELTAYLLIEDHPYEISLNVSPMFLNTKQIIENIKKEIVAEIGGDVEFNLVYAKYKEYKVPRYVNIELYHSLRNDFYKDEISEKYKQLVNKFGRENAKFLHPELYDETIKNFEIILKKYNFEKG